MRLKFFFGKAMVGVALLLASQLCGYAKYYLIRSGVDGTNITTLRGAILDANRHGAAGIIALASTNGYQLDAQAFGSELPIMNSQLTIVGLGRASVTINSTLMEHIFHVYPGARLTMINVTLTQGGGNYHYLSAIGGGVLNEGSLKLEKCSLINNWALTGAGIYNTGSLSMNNATVYANFCYGTLGGSGDGSGGGIYNAGTLTADSCTISYNRSGSGLPGGATIDDYGHLVFPVEATESIAGRDAGNGGGICNVGTCILNRCTFYENVTGSGGDSFPGFSGPLPGAFPGAKAGDGGDGAGIYNVGRLEVNRSYFSYNECGRGGFGGLSGVGYRGGDGGNGGSGGGIFNALGGTVKSYNNLFTLDFAGRAGSGGVPINFDPTLSGADGVDEFGPDVCGNFISLGYNLIWVGDGSAGFTNNIRHDVVGTLATPADPGLYKRR